MKHILASLVVLSLVVQTAPGWAAPASEDSTLEQAGYGAGSVLGTLVYAPLKATFCVLGGIGAGFTAIASRAKASQVFGASCGGTWIITPDVVKGKESVNFVGQARGAKRVDTDAVALR